MPEQNVTAPEASEGFGWLADAVLDIPSADPPLPTDQTTDNAPKVDVKTEPESKAEGEAGSDKSADDTQKVEAKPVDDPDLDKDENELVHALPAEQQEAAKTKIKETKQKASFQSRFFDPLEDKAATVDEIAKRSPSVNAALQAEYVKRATANVDSFLDDFVKKDANGYSQLVESVYKGDPKWFTEQVKKQPEIAAALDFYEQNKGLGEIPDDVMNELRDELDVDFPHTAKFLNDLRAKNVPLRADIKAQLDELKSLKEAQGKPGEKTEETKPAEDPTIKQRNDIWWGDQGVYSSLESYARTKAADQYALKVSPEERKVAPLVAALKEIKLDYLIDGGKDIPPFDDGFAQWAQNRADFKQKMQRVGKFVVNLERDNAVSAAREVLPDLDLYLNERVKHPLFSALDQLITLAASQANGKPNGQKYLPGGGAHTPKEPVKETNQWVADAALALME